MLNQSVYNPGFMDINTRYSATATFRKQWLSYTDAPLTFNANGHYNITRNHGVGMLAGTDKIDNITTTNISASYTYHAWLNSKVALGMGVKLGYEQRSIQNNYVYFAESDPTLNQLKTAGFNMGAGLSIQSRNFDFGFSLPYLFNNRMGNSSTIYSTEATTFYSNIGYKMRFNDFFVLYPTILVKGVSGAPISMSFDGHFLYNQLFWFGGGYRSDNTVSLSCGVFLDEGLRIVYSYESAYFTPHKRMDSSHEITLNYARTIKEFPFSKRTYTTRKGGQFRKKIRVKR
jgi:type IX secretion system PorP/SprF family membrane protein